MSTVAHAPNVSVELADQRTGLAFQRTRLGADRTLMAVIRTSLSLISFGFTIHHFLLQTHEGSTRADSATTARNFGLTLVLTGLGTLALGSVYHVLFMRELRKERDRMGDEQQVHDGGAFPMSPALLVAALLFIVGLLATASVGFGIGPF
jgi:putative membrane protein